MIGPGKYDYALTQAREMCGAKAAILIVFAGKQGSGFSVQVPLEILPKLPAFLRAVADDIEKDVTHDVEEIDGT